ncbi:MAG: response regulator transcription factor [Gemmatimonadaceae bacterium]|jgi:two-component system phosphate regulon response regulator PhoB|nr:response regulator transcription factor [Gemmatimonadaceae bacterium]
MNTALVVLDDPVVRDLLNASLRGCGFHPVAARDLDEAHRLAVQVRPDVVLVDVDRFPPDAHPARLDWARPPNGGPARVPTIMLTAHPDTVCGPRGERCGGSHCAPKPFRASDLVMTAVRLTRRANARRLDVRWSGTIRRGPIELDMDRFTMSVDVDGRRVPFGLGPTVTRLMAQLMREPGAVCSREELLATVWPDDATVTPRTVDQNVRRIRASLRSVGLDDTIATVHGQGYSFVEPGRPAGL